MTDSRHSRLDDLIEAALTEQDRQILEGTDELGYFALGRSQFRGKLGWVTWLIMALQAGLFVIGAWCAVRFFASDDVLNALKWGLPSAVLVLMAIQLKLSLMPQMQADRIIREIKRLELLIVSRDS